MSLSFELPPQTSYRILGCTQRGPQANESKHAVIHGGLGACAGRRGGGREHTGHSAPETQALAPARAAGSSSRRRQVRCAAASLQGRRAGHSLPPQWLQLPTPRTGVWGYPQLPLLITDPSAMTGAGASASPPRKGHTAPGMGRACLRRAWSPSACVSEATEAPRGQAACPKLRVDVNWTSLTAPRSPRAERSREGH